MLALLSFVLIAATEPPAKASAPPAASPQPATPADPTPAAGTQPAAGAADVAAGSGAVFRTRKSLADLEKCLTDRLSQGGEVTSVPIEGVKTLMYQTVDEPAMMIDLAPPVVKVTTKFAIGTEPIVRSCL